jgi:ketosteroid isomerase-like protein
MTTPSAQEKIDAVLAADKARAAAILAKQFDVLSGYLSEQMLYVHSSSTQETKSEYLDRLRTAFYEYTVLDKGEVTARVHGDVVLLTGRVLIHVAVKGTPKVINASYLSVWGQEAGQWRMVAWQSTPVPQA